MAILFNKIERANPQNRSVKKWYPSLKTIKRISEKEVAKQIADETTMNRKEAEMALTQFQKVLVSNLLASNSVQLGDWGSFRLTCTGDGANSAGDVTAKNIKGLNIRFTPGAELREALAKASFVAAESVVSK